MAACVEGGGATLAPAFHTIHWSPSFGGRPDLPAIVVRRRRRRVRADRAGPSNGRLIRRRRRVTIARAAAGQAPGSASPTSSHSLRPGDDPARRRPPPGAVVDGGRRAVCVVAAVAEPIGLTASSPASPPALEPLAAREPGWPSSSAATWVSGAGRLRGRLRRCSVGTVPACSSTRTSAPGPAPPSPTSPFSGPGRHRARCSSPTPPDRRPVDDAARDRGPPPPPAARLEGDLPLGAFVDAVVAAAATGGPLCRRGALRRAARGRARVRRPSDARRARSIRDDRGGAVKTCRIGSLEVSGIGVGCNYLRGPSTPPATVGLGPESLQPARPAPKSDDVLDACRRHGLAFVPFFSPRVRCADRQVPGRRAAAAGFADAALGARSAGFIDDDRLATVACLTAYAEARIGTRARAGDQLANVQPSGGDGDRRLHEPGPGRGERRRRRLGAHECRAGRGGGAPRREPAVSRFDGAVPRATGAVSGVGAAVARRLSATAPGPPASTWTSWRRRRPCCAPGGCRRRRRRRRLGA